MIRAAKTIIVTAAVIGAAIALVSASERSDTAPGVDRPTLVGTAPMALAEARQNGEHVVHQVLQADVRAPARADEAELRTFAQDLFEARLRAEADAQARTMVWITFAYPASTRTILGVITLNATRTYREVYVLGDAGWRRLDRPGTQKV